MKRYASKYQLSSKDFLYIGFGSFLAAIAYHGFLLPNHIVAGGVSGISTVFYSLFKTNPSLVQFAINVPLLVLCFWLLGRAAGYKTVLGSLLLPLFVGATSFINPVTHNPLLAAVFGGVITGAGIGIVFRAKASTGGTSIIAQIFHEYFHLPLGISTGLVDGLIILMAFVAFDAEVVMYSLIALFLMSRTIDLTQVGLGLSKNVLIISDTPEIIRKEILYTLNRGVTNLGIKGGYGNKDLEMLMCVISEQEFTVLKDTILNADPDAFVVVMPASEVLGRGFTLHKQFPFPESSDQVQK